MMWNFRQTTSVLYLAIICIIIIKYANGENCSENEIPCDNFQCILRSEWCDVNKNCDDGSDEKYCEKIGWSLFGPKDPNQCQNTHFLCGDGVCFPLAVKCDQHVDCEDGSDEKCIEETSTTYEETDGKGFDFDVKFENGIFDETADSSSTFVPPTERESSSASKVSLNPTPDVAPSVRPLTQIKEATSIPDPASIAHPPSSLEKQIVTQSFYDHPQWTTTTTIGYYDRLLEIEKQNPEYYRPANSYAANGDYYNNYRKVYGNDYQPATPAYDQLGRQHYTHNENHHYGNEFANTRHQPLNEYGVLSTYPTAHSNAHYGQNAYLQTDENGHYPAYDRRPDWNQRDAQSGNDHEEDIKYSRRRNVLAPFNFIQNYANIYERKYSYNVLLGEQWLLGRQNTAGGRIEDASRTIIALSLVNNSFVSGSHKTDLIRRNFQVQLGINLFRNKSNISLSKLAIYINAVIASCQDPKDFLGQNLVQLLRTRLDTKIRSSSSFVNPIVYLSLCLAGESTTQQVPRSVEEAVRDSAEGERAKDMKILALTTLACYLQERRDNAFLRSLIDEEIENLLQHRKDDGSFGSIYSTALATQALISSDTGQHWYPEQTMDFLLSHQKADGSFGDLLATYYILPVLRGRSLLHLRNTKCDPSMSDRELTPEEILNHPGLKHYVHYFLHFGDPLQRSYSITVNVPVGINFFDVMRIAQHLNAKFKFTYNADDNNVHIDSISNIPNDPEMGLYWNLYVKQHPGNEAQLVKEELYTADIRNFIPTGSERIIYWYHPT